MSLTHHTPTAELDRAINNGGRAMADDGKAARKTELDRLVAAPYPLGKRERQRMRRLMNAERARDMADDTPSKFWMVWGFDKGTPRFKHSSLAEAVDEATRLATQHPRVEFYVLEAVGRAAADAPPVPPVTYTALPVEA
jgi:hypothetical protein